MSVDCDDHLSQNLKIEGEILQQLLTMEKEFRDHNALMKTELLLQKDLISRMWVLSQRYVLLARYRLIGK